MTDPTSRALTLLGLLEHRVLWSGADLADHLGVTARTVRRDIERLRSLGYTIDAEPGGAGGYSLGRGQVLPPLLLDEDEAIAITLALSEAALGAEGREAEAALRALAKIHNVTPLSVRLRLEGLREAIVPSAHSAGVSGESLVACAEAVRQRRRLTFDYHDRHGTTTQRRVEPHGLRARGRTWRMMAYDLDRGDWRTFRLDRLAHASVGTWRFTPRPDADEAVARLDQATPVEAWRHRLHLRIHAPLEEVRAAIPQFAGHLTAVDAHTTDVVSGADDPRDAAHYIAFVEHAFVEHAFVEHACTVLGDAEVIAAVRRLGDRLSRSAL